MNGSGAESEIAMKAKSSARNRQPENATACTEPRQQAFETLVLSRNKQSIFNHYCANCRCTQTFRDQGSHLSCPTCKKTLWPAATEACRRAG